MLTLSQLTHRALLVETTGDISRDDIVRILAEFERILAVTPEVDLLADVHGSPRITLGLLVEEMKHIPSLLHIVRALDRIALIADAEWIRDLAEIEASLIPGVTYEVYPRADAAHARLWLLRETDEAHVPAPAA